MATEPSPVSIGSLAAVTGLPLGDASKWLKVQLPSYNQCVQGPLANMTSLMFRYTIVTLKKP